jgi:hypothetical protein
VPPHTLLETQHWYFHSCKSSHAYRLAQGG